MTNPHLTSAHWRKSSYSATQGECVEVAPLAGGVGVRDSKRRRAGTLVTTRTAWSVFAAAPPRRR